MGKAMKFVKGAGTNVKLECRCGRKFWWHQEHQNSCDSDERPGFKTARCPDCKIKWNGTYVTVFEPEMKRWLWGARRKDSQWEILGVFEAVDFKHLVLGVQATVPFVFHSEDVTGMHFAEIDVETYGKVKQHLRKLNDGVDGTLEDFLKLQARLGDRLQ